MVFGGGWPPSLLDSMSFSEFCDWYERAKAENDAMKKAMDKR